MVLVEWPAVMAAIAPRLVQPGIGIVFHSGHAAVTVNTSHALGRHGIAQALGLWAGMTVITAIQSIGNFIRMLVMHCMG